MRNGLRASWLRAEASLGRMRAATAFAIGVVGLAWFVAFALLRPLASPGPYYGPRPHASGYSYAWFVLAMFPGYAVALWAARREDGPSLRTVLVAAAALSVPLMCAPLIQSQDLYQYLFYARLQVVHGANPYVVAPVAFAHDAWFGFVSWPHQLSVYGPLWSLAMAGIVRSSGGSVLRAMLLAKAFAVGLGALTLWGLVRLAETPPDTRGAGSAWRPAAVIAAFALNPVVLSTVALSGHADAAVAAGFVGAMLADRRRRPVVGALLLGAATLVKLYAGLALAVYLIAVWRRDGTRTAARAAAAPTALGAVTFVPYWSGARTFAGVASIAEHASASLARAVSEVMARALRLFGVHDAAGVALAAVRVAGVAVVVAVLVHQARRPRTSDPWAGVMAVTAAYLLVTPWFLPWHLLGLLALACALPDSPLSVPTLVGSGSCLASVGGLGPVSPVATAAIRYGPPVLTYIRNRHGAGRRRGPALATGPDRSRGPAPA